MRKVLIVDDDLVRGTTLRRGLVAEGYEVLWARDPETGLRLASEGEVDLVILSSAPENHTDEHAIETLRDRTHNARLLVQPQTPRPPPNGGNAPQPEFNLLETIARVGALLRSEVETVQESESMRVGEIEVDFSRQTVRCGLRRVDLSPREFALLWYLIERRGEVVSREELLEAVWGNLGSNITRTVDVHMAKLRKKLGDSSREPEYIQTIRGIGYRLAT